MTSHEITELLENNDVALPVQWWRSERALMITQVRAGRAGLIRV